MYQDNKFGCWIILFFLMYWIIIKKTGKKLKKRVRLISLSNAKNNLDIVNVCSKRDL